MKHTQDMQSLTRATAVALLVSSPLASLPPSPSLPPHGREGHDFYTAARVLISYHAQH